MVESLPHGRERAHVVCVLLLVVAAAILSNGRDESLQDPSIWAVTFRARKRPLLVEAVNKFGLASEIHISPMEIRIERRLMHHHRLLHHVAGVHVHRHEELLVRIIRWFARFSNPHLPRLPGFGHVFGGRWPRWRRAFAAARCSRGWE
jgi:hypothetical protein